MIAGMKPALQPGQFVFVTSPDAPSDMMRSAVASYVEAEGMSLILPVEVAQANGFDVSLPMRCITLQVHSALDGVGLTAAVATALSDQDIPCNMVAAYHHDHAYVPERKAEQALALLQDLAAPNR